MDEKFKKSCKLAGAIIICILLCCTSFYFGHSRRIEYYQATIDNLNTDIADIKGSNKEFERIKWEFEEQQRSDERTINNLRVENSKFRTDIAELRKANNRITNFAATQGEIIDRLQQTGLKATATSDEIDQGLREALERVEKLEEQLLYKDGDSNNN